MKEVISGSIRSSKENFNLLSARKNSIKLARLVKLIKAKKGDKRA